MCAFIRTILYIHLLDVYIYVLCTQYISTQKHTRQVIPWAAQYIYMFNILLFVFVERTTYEDEYRFNQNVFSNARGIAKFERQLVRYRYSITSTEYNIIMSLYILRVNKCARKLNLNSLEGILQFLKISFFSQLFNLLILLTFDTKIVRLYDKQRLISYTTHIMPETIIIQQK